MFHKNKIEEHWDRWLDLELERYRLEQETLKDINDGKLVWDNKLMKFVLPKKIKKK